MGCDVNKRPARVVKNGKEKRTEKLKVPRSLSLTDALGPMICQRDLWVNSYATSSRPIFLFKQAHSC